MVFTMMMFNLFRTYAKSAIAPRWPTVWFALVWFYRKLLRVRYRIRGLQNHIRWRWRYLQLVLKSPGTQINELPRGQTQGYQAKENKNPTSEIVNISCNSGPITPADFSESVESVWWAYAGVTERSVLSGELRGYAVNDALRFETPEMLYSFAGLALKIIACAKSILKVKPERLSVLELGCGSGALGHLLLRRGVLNYVGIEGNALAGRFSPYMRPHRSRFLFLNLQEPIELYENKARLYFYIVCSFEVLEHIVESKLGIFLRTVTEHLKEGGLFICSASTGDWGDVHITIKPRSWWLERFAAYGLVEFASDHWEQKIARAHPYNWTPERSNVFLLRKGK